MTKNSDFWIKTDIAELARQERECFRRRRRFAFFEYLESVLDYAADLDRKGSLKATAQRIARIVGQRRRKTDPLKVIIDASSAADRKTRSRWGRALRCAFDRREGWRGKMTLAQFFRKNGGVSGCARKVAKRRFHRPREIMRDWDWRPESRI